ncbi:MAG: hypothetical protein JXR31_04905 [Prolixibacteraceae bacterium]|nr:hypothetical protein [Prolixibacteraceae bacterium]
MKIPFYNQNFSLFFSESTNIPGDNCYVVKRKCKRTSYAHLKEMLNGLLLIFLIGLFPITVFAQGQSNENEAEWNGYGYSLKKVVSNTSIPSGVNFSYTILFTAPAGATTVTIQDMIPPALEVVSLPTPAIVNGVTPSLVLSGTPMVNEVVTYTLTGLPVASAASGSFTIVVKFREGITCNVAAARNRAGIFVNGEWQYTPYVSTIATAADPWVVYKSIVSGPVVNPSGGACGYIMEPGDTVTYRLSVMKTSPYYGNVVGQQNMNNAVVTDMLPPGAIMLSSTCGIPANSTGTITWMPNSGILDAANPWAYYYCDITVYYPSASFPNGSFVYNQVDLDGDICNQQVNHQSNQTCIEIGQVIANPNGFFQKYISLTNRVPGCSGLYTIVFCNNGNVPLSAFNIDDVIPSGVSVDQVAVYGGSGTTTMNITANSGANTIASGISSSYFNSGTIGYTVNDLQLQMTGSLPVGACIYFYVYFTVEPNPTGTIVTNCATFNGLANGLTLPQTCVSFTVDAGEPHACILKDICSPQSSYEPGDIIRMRLRVQNIGSATLSGANIQDILHSNFTYVGNETYYISNTYNPPCSTGSSIPSGTTAWSGVTSSHSGNNLSWSLPDISSDCQLFYVAYCGYYGTWTLPYYFIEFDVQVSNTALPGVTPNDFDIYGGNLSMSETSNTVYVLVVASFGQEVQKEVSTDNGSSFASSGTTSPGATARYRLSYKNTSNVPVTSVNLVDLLPRNDGTNDWLVLNRSVSRGSQFDVTYNSNHTTSLLPSGTPPVPVLNYASGLNICLPPFGINSGCNPTTWGTSPDQNIRVNYGTFLLSPANTVREEFDVLIPSNATSQQTVCNDFAAISTASFLLNGNPQSVALTPIAAPPVCLTIDTTSTSTSCCDSISVEQFSDPTGGGDCCFRITTDCEVKSINVSVTNGTLNSASWNCGNLPSGYIGQSSYTFAANNCVVDMTACVNPGQGPVSVNVAIDFANGERCEKTIDLDCGTTQTHCCDSLIVERAPGADGIIGCCARIATECEVDSIVVNLGNGTISAVNWNCGPLPSGFIGQNSFTFNASGCATDMTFCIDPNQSGIVIANVTVYFSNGEVCERVLDLDCVAQENCCDSIRIQPVSDPTGMDECCAEIISECEVDSILVKVGNGVLATATWNCGNLPNDYIGQNTYTFNVNQCAADLITCVEPDSTGIVTISYLVYLPNGEKCEQHIELDCLVVEKNCCDSVKVEHYQLPGTNECCSRITTDCEVKSIDVTISNGTFVSTSWNCGNLPTGYIGQSSYTFAPENCAIEMVNCVTPDQTGIVTVNYVINFANGESCEKVVELDCMVSNHNCCDSVRVDVLPDASATGKCCAWLRTDCDVDSVNINITNGVISSTTWNCGVLPTGFVGQSNFTFNANLCTVDMITCVDPDSTGIVYIDYVVYFNNGEVCDKRIQLDCIDMEVNCCDSVRVENVVNADGTVGCCAKLTTDCEVESVEVSVSNGTISSSMWNCGTLPSGYMGQSNYTFPANGCMVEMTNCFDALQSGVVTVTYTVTFLNGEKCEKTIELDCEAPTSDCCALVDFKLKSVWPYWGSQVGTFNITNLDPSSPICSVLISASPSGTFTPLNLVVDGVNSTQTWNSSSIPVSGNLSPAAVNDIKFSLFGNYKGTITICVVKCDGTRCCFDFNWNKKIIVDVGIEIGQLPVPGKLVALTLNPVVTSDIQEKVKYVSFGMADEQEVMESQAEFFAISGTEHEGDDYPENLATPVAAYMSKHNAFFEIGTPKGSGEELGAFNLVISNKLPKLGCTLFDEDGNIIFSGEIDVSESDTLTTSVIQQGNLSGSLFEFINLYPNPSDGSFTVKYAVGTDRKVEVRIVGSLGKVVKLLTPENTQPGIHELNVDANNLPGGFYKVVLYSEGDLLSKSAVIKK